MNSSTASDGDRLPVRIVDVNGAETTHVKITSLLPQHTYVVEVAAKTGAGVGASDVILVHTRSYTVRAYSIYVHFQASGSFRKKGTLSSQAEIDVWVKAPGRCDGARGVSSPEKKLRFYKQNPAMYFVAGKWFATSYTMRSGSL